MTYIGIWIPFFGTALGAACVFFLKDELNPLLQKILLGFASGVMVAASFWSLILPATEMAESSGRSPLVSVALGIAAGMGVLLLLDKIIPHLHVESNTPEGMPSHLGKATMLVLAVTLHNIPEGMAVGVVFAGLKEGTHTLTLMGALALAIGIAIQNFPEGAIISMPLKSTGISRRRAFAYGALSGIVEPIGAWITIALTGIMLPILPFLLAFAAGAMLYVVVEELIPEANVGEHSNVGTIGFGAGFLVMMILDMTLG